MNHINILTANINRFARYSYIILKRMMTHRLNLYKILFRYILHIIIIITYKLYKYNCDFYMSPNVVIVIDNNDNVVSIFPLDRFPFIGVLRPHPKKISLGILSQYFPAPRHIYRPFISLA